MRLSEALSLRKDVQRRIEQLRERAAVNAVVQEGETPAEDPNALLREARENVTTWQSLVQQINLTNAVTLMEDGTPLTAAIAQRDALKLHYSILTKVANAASPTSTEDRHYRHPLMKRAMRSELRDVPQVDVTELRRQADDVARQFRELDQRIQVVNFTRDLIES